MVWMLHVQAAQAMQAYSSWQPKEFDDQQAQASAGAPADTADAPGGAPTTAGFVYDSNSGASQGSILLAYA